MSALGLDPALLNMPRGDIDLIVGDTNEEINMATKALTRKAALVQGASLAFLADRLASDEMPNLTAAFRGVTAKNYVTKKPAIAAAITKATDGFLAQDASLDGLNELLDKFDDEKPVEDEEAPVAGKAVLAEKKDEKVSEDEGEDVVAKLAARLDAIEAVVAKMAKAERAEAEENLSEDEDPENPEKKEDEDMVTKSAMDAAIAAAGKAAEAKAAKTREAERAVRPYVGDLAMSFDSADAVYEAALKSLGVKTDGIHPSAFPAILAMQPKPGSKRPSPAVALDAAGGKTLADRFPDAARVRII